MSPFYHCHSPTLQFYSCGIVLANVNHLCRLVNSRLMIDVMGVYLGRFQWLHSRPALIWSTTAKRIAECPAEMGRWTAGWIKRVPVLVLMFVIRSLCSTWMALAFGVTADMSPPCCPKHIRSISSNMADNASLAMASVPAPTLHRRRRQALSKQETCAQRQEQHCEDLSDTLVETWPHICQRICVSLALTSLPAAV